MTQQVKVKIDGNEYSAPAGEKLLRVALDNDIYIPHLCYIRERQIPQASCRLCFVEVYGRAEPQPACTLTVAEGLSVNTRGERALELARTGFVLLMSAHPVDCAHCLANGACELQKIARHLKVSLKPKALPRIERNLPVDSSHSRFTLDPNKCVLCGQCLWVCREKLQSGILGYVGRGFDRVIGTFAGEPLAGARCEGCEACIAACPTGALCLKDTPKKDMPASAI